MVSFFHLQAFNVLSAIIKQRDDPGVRSESKVLEVRDVRSKVLEVRDVDVSDAF